MSYIEILDGNGGRVRAVLSQSRLYDAQMENIIATITPSSVADGEDGDEVFDVVGVCVIDAKTSAIVARIDKGVVTRGNSRNVISIFREDGTLCNHDGSIVQLVMPGVISKAQVAAIMRYVQGSI